MLLLAKAEVWSFKLASCNHWLLKIVDILSLQVAYTVLSIAAPYLQVVHSSSGIISGLFAYRVKTSTSQSTSLDIAQFLN